MSAISFIRMVGSAAQASEMQTGISAAFVLAQAALESGWGGSELAQRGKNLFGVKVYPGWEGATMLLPTREFLNGKWTTVQANWCVYLSWEDSIIDHAKFFYQNPRYAQALKVRANAKDFAMAVWKAGYATDPEYPGKIAAIIDFHDLEEWDVPKEKWVLADFAKGVVDEQDAGSSHYG